MALQPISEKHLFYENQGGHVGIDGNQLLLERNPLWFWNDRLILVEHESDDNFWRFTALDLITNETRPVHFPKSQSNFLRVRITPLTNDYGFIVESLDNDCCVNLVKLKWAPGEFEAIEQLNQAHQFSGIFVNNVSSSKFVLSYRNVNQFTYQACNLDSGKIEFTNILQSNSFFEHCFDDKLFVIDGNQIKTYDWKTAKEKSVRIEDNLNGDIDRYRTCWIKDRLYLATRFDDADGTRKSGIAYTDLETKRWTSIDFEIDMRISRIQYFDGNLIVYTNNADGNGFDSARDDSTYSNEFKVYSIPIKQPQKLRRMAWLLVLQEFKRDESIDDPYQEATRFLPFNSDLRPSWYKEEAALEELASNDQSENEAAEDNTSSSQDSVDNLAPKRQKLN